MPRRSSLEFARHDTPIPLGPAAAVTRGRISATRASCVASVVFRAASTSHVEWSGTRRKSFVNSVHGKTMPIRMRVVAIALSMASGSVGAACLTHRSAKDPRVAGTIYSPKRMPDGKQWTTDNLNVDIDGSYCYEDAELNCRRYGRLYTWESAQRGCHSLGDGWRLPTEDEWRQLAKHFGGVRDDSDDGGKAAYAALLIGGRSGFNALLGGGRASDDGQYARLEAHGFYWTASESNPASAWFYNFGKGGSSLNRQREGTKQMAVSVRCVRE